MWESIAVLVMRTTTRRHTIAEAEADLNLLNSNLGHHTNFVNLLDLGQ